GLVLGRVGGAVQLGLPAAGDDAGVVPRGHVVGPELPAVVPELAELEPVVADDAGVGRPPGQVLVGEVVHDAGEVVLEVQGVEGQVQPVRDPAGVAGVHGAAAALLVGGPAVLGRVDAGAHEQADHLVALLLEQQRGHGAVHAAAHRPHHAPGHGALRFTTVFSIMGGGRDGNNAAPAVLGLPLPRGRGGKRRPPVFYLTPQSDCLSLALRQNVFGYRHMARTPQDITDAELAVLQVLWDAGP